VRYPNRRPPFGWVALGAAALAALASARSVAAPPNRQTEPRALSQSGVAESDEDDTSSDPDEESGPSSDEADEVDSALLGAPDEVDDEAADTASSPDAGRKHKPHRGGCPASMVRVRDFCVDRYEAPDRRGAKPLIMQSANDAVAWCATRNKRLCTEDEWIETCEGEEQRAYPYGEAHIDGRCNDDKPWRKVDEATLAKWPAAEARAHAKELYQATPSGSKHRCISEDGVRDLTGNVEEWVARTRDHDNDWPYVLIGCYWSGCYGGGKPTCRSTNDAHGPEFRFYETGFRCCRDAKKPK
jgi:hypothetical protein